MCGRHDLEDFSESTCKTEVQAGALRLLRKRYREVDDLLADTEVVAKRALNQFKERVTAEDLQTAESLFDAKLSEFSRSKAKRRLPFHEEP